jgi:hypothetical protein
MVLLIKVHFDSVSDIVKIANGECVLTKIEVKTTIHFPIFTLRFWQFISVQNVDILVCWNSVM